VVLISVAFACHLAALGLPFLGARWLGRQRRAGQGSRIADEDEEAGLWTGPTFESAGGGWWRWWQEWD
jgi:hypothetical protein